MNIRDYIDGGILVSVLSVGYYLWIRYGNPAEIKLKKDNEALRKENTDLRVENATLKGNITTTELKAEIKHLGKKK